MEFEKFLNFLLALRISEPIHQLNASVFDSLSQSNISLSSFLFTDYTINLDGLGISSIEPNTFTNYRVPVRTIVLASNFLSYLPNHIFQSFSTTLMNLNLQRNRFRSLQNNSFLRRLEQLRTLDLSKNQLYELHRQDFTNLKRLETLILRENKLTNLSYALFSRCRTITTLDLSDNHISMIDFHAFRSLYRLKTLLLSNNPLGQRSLTYQLLEPLKNLENIDLENTELNDLLPYLFISNQRLRSIKLRRNNFERTVNDSTPKLQRTFCQAYSLVEIDLVSTKIHSLDICTYDQIPSLRRLYLMNNPLHCTCDLFYLKYGDIYRLLLTDGNGIDRVHSDIDTYLDRWISRPELRRHLEKAYAHGDFYRLPIELSLFARCATPTEWSGREIDNITGIFTKCQQRWSYIEQECQNYCQLDRNTEVSMATTEHISSRTIRCNPFVVQLFFILLALLVCT